jgi:hypothetical protein
MVLRGDGDRRNLDLRITGHTGDLNHCSGRPRFLGAFPQMHVAIDDLHSDMLHAIFQQPS